MVAVMFWFRKNLENHLFGLFVSNNIFFEHWNHLDVESLFVTT